jgi:hypothetical protein
MNLKPFDKSVVMSVLEETVLAQNDKIKRLKQKIIILRQDNADYKQGFNKLLCANEFMQEELI